jgi:ubiquitin carboxyl-terminal hydrolase L5
LEVNELTQQLMFNLLAIRSAAVPRLTRQINDDATPAAEKYQLSDQLEHEKSKAARGKLENTLRQNNLLPVVFQLFKEMGKSGTMGEHRLCAQLVSGPILIRQTRPLRMPGQRAGRGEKRQKRRARRSRSCS